MSQTEPATFYHNFRIYLDDTDAGGIVYHTNHIKYMEHARREWLRQQNIRHYTAQGDYQFVVSHIDINYRKPLMMDDLITVSLAAQKVRAASMIVVQSIYRNTADLEAQAPASTATITLACIDKSLKPTAIPPHIATLLPKT